MTQITDKWAAYESNNKEDIEVYNRIKSHLHKWSIVESEHGGLKREDIISLLWYVVACLFGGVGLYTFLRNIWFW